jgi:hypothetical protein
MIPLRCIYCGQEASFIVGGQSVCRKHIKYPRFDVPHCDEFDKFANALEDEE